MGCTNLGYMKNIYKLLISLAVCQLVALMGSIVTFPAIGGWYRTLNKPIFNPPNWIFGPVWTILFLLMGYSLFLVWKKGIKTKKNKVAILVFFCQLGLNFLWSFFFFGLHLPLLAFFEIIVLWIAISLTIVKFWKISKPAAYLLYPYLAWVSFATILNLSIVILN